MDIQELIEGYLDDEYGYFNMKLSREFEEFIKESEETEMNKDIRISNDVRASLVEQEGHLLLAIIVQDGYREARSINLVDEEITELRDFLNEGVEELEE